MVRVIVVGWLGRDWRGGPSRPCPGLDFPVHRTALRNGLAREPYPVRGPFHVGSPVVPCSTITAKACGARRAERCWVQAGRVTPGRGRGALRDLPVLECADRRDAGVTALRDG